jgi:signal transduction histidine kinase
MSKLQSVLSQNMGLIINSIGDGVVAADSEGKMVYYNLPAENMVGLNISKDDPEKWTEQYGIFKSDKTTLCPTDALPLVLAINGTETNGVILFIRNANRPEGLFISVTGRPVFDGNSKVIGGVIVLKDMTSRIKAEEELKSENIVLQAINEDLESFSQVVAHELRMPLRSIIGFSDILLKKYSSDLNTECIDYLSRIRNSGDKLGQLIDGILDLSLVTRDEMKLEKVNLSEIVKNVASDLKVLDSNRNVQFKIVENIIVSADPRLIRSVIVNLMSNAWKFSSKKIESKIEFGISLADNNKISYFIKDNGAGFNKKYSNKLFNIFQRLHAIKDFEGNGIGLATVKRIIHKHGGTIWAEGRLDEGATFYFTL